MPDVHLATQMAHVAKRIGRLWMWRRLTLLWCTFAGLTIVWAILGRPSITWASLLPVIGTAVLYVAIRSRFVCRSHAEIARHIERAFPDLKARLLAALEQAPDAKSGRLNILQRQVIAEAVHHSRMNDWSDSVPRRQLTRAFAGQMAALSLFVLAGLVSIQLGSRTANAVAKSGTRPTILESQLSVLVEPGNAELERGTSVLVMARFQGKSPAEASVVWHDSTGKEQAQSLTKSLDDPVFATRLSPLKGAITYHIEYDRRRSPDYKIEVYDLPALVRSDLRLTYPAYTRLPEKTLEEAFDASVVERTKVTIQCRLNKFVTTALLESDDGTTLKLQASSSDPHVYSVQFVPPKSQRLKLQLVDDAKRTNRDPEEFRIDVVPNRVPDLKITFPGKDVKVSPLEEIQIDGSVMDDFGVIEVGLVAEVAGRDPITSPLAKDIATGVRQTFSAIERLEDRKVQPDELITFHLYAVDYGPDGVERTTQSDVFFAEVRSFDETFRQSDGQLPFEIQSQQLPPDSLGKLIELQRQIVIVTWKLARLAAATEKSQIENDLKTVHESQLQAIEKLQNVRAKMDLPALRPIFQKVDQAMQNAIRELEQAKSPPHIIPLRSAMKAEQDSYNGLLKLRAKEHLLLQAKGSGSSEPQEKIDLELKKKKDLYESEKAGTKKEESNINREALAILDRLNELARRQQGINQQLKDLESQARLAKTETEREEIERQLKRLREEQQQLLHDADELRTKLNNSLQQEMVNSTKEQLEQTRQRMVDTAEKLREGQLSQALNSGTRAERELKQLSEDFRKQTAAQFADAMRELRGDARRIAEQEKQLANRLEQLTDTTRRNLRESQERAMLQAEFHEQQQQATRLMEKAKQVVEQAETSEPLLAKQLYDTLRGARDQQLVPALTAAQKLLNQGIIPEASRAEKQAQVALDQLKDGIEKAAESVLGNEVESLKRARKELAELSNSLDQEIRDQGRPGKSGQSQSATSGQKPGSGTQPGKSNASQQGQGSNPATGNGENQRGKGSSQANGDHSGSGGEGSGDPPDSSNPTGSPGEPGQNGGRPAQASLRAKRPPGAGKPSLGREGYTSDDSGGGGTAGNSQGSGPMTGDKFSEFNEQLRDIESMLSDPQLQADVQKVRDRARSVRAEFKRHTLAPNWELVRKTVHEPMLELQQRIAEEIAKRESPESLVPVDRDPVPSRYRDLVRQYYEGLSADRDEQ